MKVLFSDDEKSVRMAAELALKRAGYSVIMASNGDEAWEKITKEKPSIAILDIKMPGLSGLKVLELINSELGDEISVIMVSAYNDMATTIKAMSLGAYDFLAKPLDIDVLIDTIKKAENAQNSNKNINKKSKPDIIIEKSEKMHEIYKLIGRISHSDVTVLITGESGVGKEVIARAIHENSLRSDKRFLAVNCTAIPVNLIESELFGYEKGAFTGAHGEKSGKFEMADGGTLFLDEIGDMGIEVQSKLLRVLQEREIVRVGGNVPIPVDIRILAATNKNLLQAIKDGEFREDLYHRLKVIQIQVPPLRERRADIPILSEYFMKNYNINYESSVSSISKDSFRILTEYDWPGNIRELKNVIESAIASCRDNILLPEHINLENKEVLIPEYDKEIGLEDMLDKECKRLLELDSSDIFDNIVSRVEKRVIMNCLKFYSGNQVKTASALGINRNTLRTKIEKYSIRG